MASNGNKDTRTRKWQVTINNPEKLGYDHDKIKDILSQFKGLAYWCMCDEIGFENKTPHTHIFLYSSNGIKFSTIKTRFEGGHFEMCKGTCQANYDYIRKEGKWEKDKKKDTNLINTFEEFGALPLERQGHRSDNEDILDMIRDGLNDIEIIEECPQQMFNIDKIESIRQRYLSKQFENIFRKMEVTYIWGTAGSGKSRFVTDKYGFENVCRITDYRKNPFDHYKGQDILVLEEFRSSFLLEEILNYLDGYPLLLPCRFHNKQACFTKIYIISNIPLELQYPKIQREQHESWNAFLRRINWICEFDQYGNKPLLSTSEWLKNRTKVMFEEIPLEDDPLERESYFEWINKS